MNPEKIRIPTNPISVSTRTEPDGRSAVYANDTRCWVSDCDDPGQAASDAIDMCVEISRRIRQWRKEAMDIAEQVLYEGRDSIVIVPRKGCSLPELKIFP